MSREERIACIVKTLRPTDPGSWEPNILYVTAEFDSYDAAQRTEIEGLRDQVDTWFSRHEALKTAKQNCEQALSTAQARAEAAEAYNIQRICDLERHLAQAREALEFVKDMLLQQYSGNEEYLEKNAHEYLASAYIRIKQALTPEPPRDQCSVHVPHPGHDWCKGIPFPKPEPPRGGGV